MTQRYRNIHKFAQLFVVNLKWLSFNLKCPVDLNAMSTEVYRGVQEFTLAQPQKRLK
jgi:hypothetical protein